MTTDEQLLERVHREAARRIRRRRAAASAAVVIAVIGLSAAAAAVTSRDPEHVVITTAPERTTTTATATTSTVVPSTSSTSTSTTTSTTSTTSTTVPPTTTTIAPIAPVTGSNQSGGLKATVTATQDRSRPGVVQLSIRVEDGHGGRPTGYVLWDQEAYTLWGDAGTEDGSGGFPGWLFSECDEVMDTDPATNLAPDPHATVLDRTTVLTHDYGSATGDTLIRVAIYTSLCSTDEESTPIELVVPIP
ncbi:hypothetical protein ACE2AJ_12775 [Aquihabitans daechungensis]|uniref:hypothetical protein n=1 Tax=Aquihabitans daechungensis TaxID=1052257 RepID=UPI003BA0FA7A